MLAGGWKDDHLPTYKSLFLLSLVIIFIDRVEKNKDERERENERKCDILYGWNT